MENKKRKRTFLVIFVILVIGLVGITYAFFNYTRTGLSNVIRTGKIEFATSQNSTINLPNVFPIVANTTNLSDNTKVGTATIDISGDTTYDGGIEYLVSVVNVQNTIGTGANTKKVPISIVVEYNEKTNKDIGTESTEYFSLRGDTTSYYRLLTNNIVLDDGELLVGYIAKGVTGIDGTITIKAYLDDSKIGISDTYDGNESDNMGTTNAWARGKTILTTTEWNNLQSNGISFQIKVEANEGVWVEDTTDPEFEIGGANAITMLKSADTTSHYEIIRYGTVNQNDTANLFLSTDDESVSMSDGVVTIDENTTLNSIRLGATINSRTIYKTIPLNRPNELPENILATENVIQGEIAGQNSGTISSLSSYVRTDYIEVEDGKVLFFNSDTSKSSSLIMAFYDANQQFISGVVEDNDTNLSVYSINGILMVGKILSIPSNAKYMIISESKSFNTANIFNLYYLDESDVSPHSMTLDYPSSISLSGLKIVHFGDSIFGNYAPPNDIPSYISSYFGSIDYNVGIGGTRMTYHSTEKYDAFAMYNLADSVKNNDFTLQENNIASLNNTKYTNNFNTLKSIDFSKIDYITIGFGTNDVTTGMITPASNNPLNVNTFIGATRYSIEKIRTTYPNLKIILLTPIYRFYDERVDSSNRIHSTRYFTEYANALKKVSSEYDNIYVFDGLNELGIDSINRYVYFTTLDNTHPNPYGIKLYAYKLGKFIESLEK